MPGLRHYYLLAPIAAKGSKIATFTYHSSQELAVGSLVKATLRGQPGTAVVMRVETKPRFATKPIDQILPLPPLPTQLVQLAGWLADYYVAPLGRVWQTLLPPSIYSQRGTPTPRAEKSAPLPGKVKLTPAQVQAVAAITGGGSHLPYLLYGVTGSGKTQVYIELAKQHLKAGRSSIVMVPEIALTPQLTQMLAAEFGNRVILTHSGLTPAARRQVWQTALTTREPLVVVGPRSALFLPLKQIGLIVIDEAHDSSYKQDQSPRYHALATADQLAKLHHAQLVLGTATPAVTHLWLAEQDKLQLIELAEPIFKTQRQPTIVVDLKDKGQLGESWLISRPLLTQLQSTIKRRKQSLLFLNRRGSARAILCKKCGWLAECPNCQIPLTWHADRGRLICHWCGYQGSAPAACPSCGNLEVSFIGSGTQKLEAELTKLLPDARLARLDRDSFDARTINQLYQDLAKGKIDILVGTQMITKGLDLPGVETIGIILADTMLYLPDYTATERTFQLLHQVAGRAGRRDNSVSNLVIQTYSPEHPV
ncbi:primosomal protein N', partial [Candidatus Microgenomates bacterium]|nr:primosomal protein N' [Candidatus Microgenomates bacterium]